MKFNDAILGLISILISLVMMLMARHFPHIHGQAFGPSIFPNLIGIGMLICGILLTARGLRQWKQVPVVSLSEWTRSPRHIANFCFVLACLVFYLLAVNSLGFLLTVFIALGVLMIWLRREFWSSIFIAAAITTAIHQLFSRMLMVPLPGGILTALLR